MSNRLGVQSGTRDSHVKYDEVIHDRGDRCNRRCSARTITGTEKGPPALQLAEMIHIRILIEKTYRSLILLIISVKVGGQLLCNEKVECFFPVVGQYACS